MKKMFIIYELGHVDELKKYFEKWSEEKDSLIVVALSIDIEEKLTSANIPFVSAASYKKIFLDQLSNEDEMMKNFFDRSHWKEFVYRDIELPKIFQFMFRAYLQVVRYHGMQLMRIIESHPEIKEIKVFSPSEVLSATYGTLAPREIHVVMDCVKRIGEIRGISITVMPLTVVLTSFHKSLQPLIFSIKRSLFGFAIGIWNRLVVVFVRPRDTRFLISDHWKNVESFIKLLKNEECIFLDRSEIRHIPWRLLFRHRMRFVHSIDFLSQKTKEETKREAEKLQEVWRDMRKNIPEIFIWEGNSFDELLLSALDDIVRDFPKLLSEIAGTYCMYEKMRPHVVTLRASVSKQPHFSILPLVAKKYGIPSLELQHGLEYLGPGSWSREHTAEYIAVYGALVKKELMAIGYQSDKLPIIGSPRFDQNIQLIEKYKEKRDKKEKFTVLCIAPDIRAFEIYDSYSASDYFTSIAAALETEKENVHIIVKLRPGPAQEGVLRLIIDKAFLGFSYKIAHNEPISHICRETDITISCFSTALLEVLQFNIPVVIHALHPVDAQVIDFHFLPYSEAGAVRIVYTPDELKQTLSQHNHGKTTSFMTQNFCFDGRSSERYVNLMYELHDIYSLRNSEYR